jgi:hypothetical protein
MNRLSQCLATPTTVRLCPNPAQNSPFSLTQTLLLLFPARPRRPAHRTRLSISTFRSNSTCFPAPPSLESP